MCKIQKKIVSEFINKSQSIKQVNKQFKIFLNELCTYSTILEFICCSLKLERRPDDLCSALWKSREDDVCSALWMSREDDSCSALWMSWMVTMLVHFH